MSKQIPLTQGKFAIVDDADVERLSRMKWYAWKRRHTWYAVRKQQQDGKQRMVLMHRDILGLKHRDDIEADHKDSNGLNNQRNNLRVATRSQNAQNQRKQQKATTSRFKGVCWYRQAAMWHARIRVNGKLLSLGYFISESEAANAYDSAAIKHFGEFACLNF